MIAPHHTESKTLLAVQSCIAFWRLQGNSIN